MTDSGNSSATVTARSGTPKLSSSGLVDHGVGDVRQWLERLRSLGAKLSVQHSHC
jgi:hypothetical protein